MINWNTPFSFGPSTGFNMASSLAPGATGLASGAAAAGTGAAAAGGASGLLGVMGGPVGLAATGISSILGGIGASNAAEASMQAAKEQAKLGYVANIAGNRFMTRAGIGDQMRALSDRQRARQSGLYGPEDFQALLAQRMSPAAAKRELYSPIYRGVS
jgi:hypothetical protein